VLCISADGVGIWFWFLSCCWNCWNFFWSIVLVINNCW